MDLELGCHRGPTLYCGDDASIASHQAVEMISLDSPMKVEEHAEILKHYQKPAPKIKNEEEQREDCTDLAGVNVKENFLEEEQGDRAQNCFILRHTINAGSSCSDLCKDLWSYLRHINLYGSSVIMNNPEAQYTLGKLYLLGFGVKQSYEAAFKWLHRAAEHNHAGARFMLGEMYYEGHGTPISLAEAFTWYSKAAEQGHSGAQFSLGTMFREGICVARNYNKALNFYLEAAEQGHSEAQFAVGEMYRDGMGIHEDRNSAHTWFLRAANQENSMAQFALGNMYHSNPLERTKARAWLLKSAKQGHAGAQFFLGKIYYNGEGVEQDRSEAIRWYSKAAHQDHAGARRALDIITRDGLTSSIRD